MERRDVLKSASALAAASTVGMAGCSGILGGGCDTPGDNLEDSLPDSDEYEQQGEVYTDLSAEKVEDGAYAAYTDSDDNAYFFIVAEFSSEDAASEEITNTTSEEGSGSGESAFGYVQSGKYAFGASGPDEDSVKSILKASPTLSDSCVEDNVEFA